VGIGQMRLNRHPTLIFVPFVSLWWDFQFGQEQVGPQIKTTKIVIGETKSVNLD
jgi:hypothetical protein